MALAGYTVQVEFGDKDTCWTVGSRVGADTAAHVKLAPLVSNNWLKVITGTGSDGVGLPLVEEHADW